MLAELSRQGFERSYLALQDAGYPLVRDPANVAIVARALDALDAQHLVVVFVFHRGLDGGAALDLKAGGTALASR